MPTQTSLLIGTRREAFRADTELNWDECRLADTEFTSEMFEDPDFLIFLMIERDTKTGKAVSVRLFDPEKDLTSLNLIRYPED